MEARFGFGFGGDGKREAGSGEAKGVKWLEVVWSCECVCLTGWLAGRG
jgi:hypothetical protein